MQLPSTNSSKQVRYSLSIVLLTYLLTSEVGSWQPRAGDTCTVASARVSGSVMGLLNFASRAANGSWTRRVGQLIVCAHLHRPM